MEPKDILATARQPGDLPEHWTVVPLNQAIVRQSALLWTGGALVGFALLVGLYLAIRDIFSFTSFQFVLMVILGFIGVGSAYVAYSKFRKLFDADRYLIVLTPELFVEQQGAKITAVPLREISNLTLRGVFGGDLTFAQRDERDPRAAALGVGQLFGGRQMHRPRRTPDSLAFVDLRTDTPVVVAEDNSFAELPILEELIRDYIASVPRIRTS